MPVSKWHGSIEGLNEVAERFRRVEIHSRDALELIEAKDGLGTLFYCDPPYVHDTRTAPRAYGPYEMPDDDHRRLAALLNRCRAKVTISGYDHPLYDQLYPAPRWKKIIDPIKRLPANRRAVPRSEVLWVNW